MKRFRYRKIAPEDVAFMKLLRECGLSYPQIAEVFSISLATIQYHLDPGYRNWAIARQKQRNKKPEVKEYDAKRRFSQEGRKWRREYMHERYHKDPEFRMRMLK